MVLLPHSIHNKCRRTPSFGRVTITFNSESKSSRRTHTAHAQPHRMKISMDFSKSSSSSVVFIHKMRNKNKLIHSNSIDISTTHTHFIVWSDTATNWKKYWVWMVEWMWFENKILRKIVFSAFFAHTHSSHDSGRELLPSRTPQNVEIHRHPFRLGVQSPFRNTFSFRLSLLFTSFASLVHNWFSLLFGRRMSCRRGWGRNEEICMPSNCSAHA